MDGIVVGHEFGGDDGSDALDRQQGGIGLLDHGLDVIGFDVLDHVRKTQDQVRDLLYDGNAHLCHRILRRHGIVHTGLESGRLLEGSQTLFVSGFDVGQVHV